MKIRSGFVSNSSSSSFILGIGIVADEEKFRQACKDVGLSFDEHAGWRNEVAIKPLSQILADAAESSWSVPEVRGTKLVIESFTYNEVSLDFSDLDGNTLIAYMDSTGELDGDYAFSDEDGWEMNYDRSPTDNDCEKMSVFSESCGIKNGDTVGGAGRDG